MALNIAPSPVAHHAIRIVILGLLNTEVQLSQLRGAVPVMQHIMTYRIDSYDVTDGFPGNLLAFLVNSTGEFDDPAGSWQWPGDPHADESRRR